METLWIEIAKLGGSIAAILFLFWLAGRMGLGGDVRIRDEAHARALAAEALVGFEPAEVVLDKGRIAALLKDASGRHLLIRRHGAHFAGRLLDRSSKIRLDQNFLTIGAAEKSFGTVTLDLGTEAQIWAAAMRRMAA